MSSLFFPRNWRMLCSPSTQRIASATFDLPAPLGPTTAVMPGLNSSSVREAKLLKPSISNRLRYTVLFAPPFLVRQAGNILLCFSQYSCNMYGRLFKVDNTIEGYLRRVGLSGQ